jgi:hypothetical protein
MSFKNAQEAVGINKNQFEYQCRLAKKQQVVPVPTASSMPSPPRVSGAGEEGNGNKSTSSSAAKDTPNDTPSAGTDSYCQLVERVASENALENSLLVKILAEEVAHLRSEREKQDKVNAQLLKDGFQNNANAVKTANVLRQLRGQAKLLQQDIRRKDVRLGKLQAAAKDYVTDKFAIEVLNLSEKEKFAALMMLAHELIDKEVDNGDPNHLKSHQEREEEKATLKAVFCATYQNMGRCNKNGDKRGITSKINPRILALGLRLASSMSQNNYEKFKQTSPHLPSWSTLVKYKITVRKNICNIYTYLLVSLLIQKNCIIILTYELVNSLTLTHRSVRRPGFTTSSLYWPKCTRSALTSRRVGKGCVQSALTK